MGLLVAFGAELALLSTCSPPIPLAQQIQDRGVLRVATTNSPTTYFQTDAGPAGFEYDLARAFADELGVELDISVAGSTDEALEQVLRGQVHLAAGNLTVTGERRQRLFFTQAVRELTPQLVYRRGTGRPRNPAQVDAVISLPAHSAHEEILKTISSDYPELRWEMLDDHSVEDILAKIARDELVYTIADSDIVSMTRRYYPYLNVAFELGEPARKAWALRQDDDASLLNRAVLFLNQAAAGGLLDRIKDRYFSHVGRLDFVSSRSLTRHIDSRLPKYRALFEQAGERYGLDWRLLAAVSYQESHWDKQATSPTGVRGLMMLTKDTARFLKVKNRLDPAESIDGGARYLRRIIDKLPDDVPEPDRIWMALCGYNMGLGHLLDLRELTERRGGDPRAWVDVRENLALLTQKRWYSTLRYGYARGHEAQNYVANIRSYLDVLLWLTQQEDPQKKPQLAAPRPAQPVEERTPEALRLELPVL